MDPTASMVGEVRYRDGSTPRSMTVTIVSAAYRASERFYTKDGGFAFGDVPFGTYEVFVQAGGAAGGASAAVDATYVRLPEPVTIGAGHTLSGRLVAFGSSAPVGGAEVLVRDGANERPRRFVSDAKGHFEVPNVPPGRGLLLARGVPIGFEMPKRTHDLGEVPLPPPGLPRRFGFALVPRLTTKTLVVSSVVPGGAAFDAGLTAGGVVTVLRLDGETVEIVLADGHRLQVTSRSTAPAASPR
jgi:hypothetical protein